MPKSHDIQKTDLILSYGADLYRYFWIANKTVISRRSDSKSFELLTISEAINLAKKLREDYQWVVVTSSRKWDNLEEEGGDR